MLQRFCLSRKSINFFVAAISGVVYERSEWEFLEDSVQNFCLLSVFKVLCLNSYRQQLYVVRLLGMQLVLSAHFSVNIEDNVWKVTVLKPGIIFTVRVIKL